TVSAVKELGKTASAFKSDIRFLGEVKELVAETMKMFGRIDILVNNAGILRDNLITFMRDEEWNEVLDTNLKGAFYCIKIVAREMMRRKYGRIINISSDAGFLGDTMRANYASSKAGMIGLTKTAARELAPSGITVNAVAPGIIETDMVSQMTESKRKTLLSMIPMGNFGNPHHVADVVRFLASESASYITGQVVCVDGGLRMG
ncbi:MAG: 3-oxoacyl-ACP reductase FabG, partial [Lentisphaerae bacterium]|nr:3-oxoacyl-ACP reductase FabG [Lentisphaerota bacterium]